MSDTNYDPEARIAELENQLAKIRSTFTLDLSFKENAEGFQNVVDQYIRAGNIVQITPEDGSEPYDAKFLGVDFDAGVYNAVIVRRVCTDTNHLLDSAKRSHTVRVQKILVY